jgi:glycyl-tRNA synthetase, tetrameric type, beta subunit
MAKNLLFEIGTEELPSSSIIEGIKNIKTLLEGSLKNNRLVFGGVQAGATPRRITAFVESLKEQQKTEEKVITGPPKKIAFDVNGIPTAAAEGFASGLNIEVGELIEVDTGKGIYLGYKVTEEGKKTKDVLPEVLKNIILSLQFGKQMTWGNYSIKFSRPIRWIAAIYGGEVIDFKVENLSSSNITFGHRALKNEPIKIPEPGSFKQYCDFLQKEAKVILEPQKRREMILDFMKELESNVWKDSFKIIIDEGLLDEVVNLVEMPNVLAGTFPVEYLYIPKDILIKAIQHHQRYFAVLDSRGSVSTNFIIVQNGEQDKSRAIVKGNERVLKARLSDAKFFYEQDRKSSFEVWIEKLKGVIFYSQIGSLYDKEIRLSKICLKISEMLKQKGIINKDFSDVNLSRAGMLCKCDLVTDLVVEFPELQGLVGKEYAKEKGEDGEIPDAIFEHYLPRFVRDALPATLTGAILSLADKFDTISGMFLTGNIPSGSQDPFALRRKASGIVLTCLDKGFDLDISELISFSVGLYLESFDFKNKKELKKTDSAAKPAGAAGADRAPGAAGTAGVSDYAEADWPAGDFGAAEHAADVRAADYAAAVGPAGDVRAVGTAGAVFDFIMARYRFRLEKQNKRTDVFEAVMEAGCNSITQLDLRYKALETYIINYSDILKLSEPLTRCKNIIKGRQFGKVDERFLKEDAELKLYKALLQKEKTIKDLAALKSFDRVIVELAGFADSINYFFDKVLVMDKDEDVRQNRLNLVKSCTELYYLLADFSKILNYTAT